MYRCSPILLHPEALPGESYHEGSRHRSIIVRWHWGMQGCPSAKATPPCHLQETQAMLTTTLASAAGLQAGGVPGKRGCVELDLIDDIFGNINENIKHARPTYHAACKAGYRPLNPSNSQMIYLEYLHKPYSASIKLFHSQHAVRPPGHACRTARRTSYLRTQCPF